MKFTIITVCYNAQASIRNTIESVLNQSYQDYEYLIIDGESHDGTLDIIREYEKDERVHVYVEKDFGIFNAMNRGICRASGEYINFMNAGDTFFAADTLEKVVPYLTDANTIYYGFYNRTDFTGVDIVVSYSGLQGSVTDKFLRGEMPCHQAIFAPRSSLKNHFFQEKYKMRADYQWFYDSIFFGGYSSEEIPVVVANYDIFGISSDAINKKIHREEIKWVLEECFGQKQVKIPNLEMPVPTEFKWEKIADKHLKMVQVMDSWLSLKQSGISLATYFQQQGISSIAVYGLGYLGLRLLKELENEDMVRFAIDRRKLEAHIPVKTPEEELEWVDAIVVTTVNDYDTVIPLLEAKTDCRIIKFDRIIQHCLEMDKRKISERKFYE